MVLVVEDLAEDDGRIRHCNRRLRGAQPDRDHSAGIGVVNYSQYRYRGSAAVAKVVDVVVVQALGEFGRDELIAEAKRAAERQRIDLRVLVARSDQETMYLFRRMIRDIDGFWLFPDNRILSTRVLRDMLDEANRLRVPVAVPNDSMLAMGGTLSLSTVAADIADTIVSVIRKIHAGKIDLAAPITPLSEIRVTTNDSVRVADR